LEGQSKKADDFLVVALKTQAKTTKSTTPTLQNAPPPLHVMHTAAVTKDIWAKA